MGEFGDATDKQLETSTMDSSDALGNSLSRASSGDECCTPPFPDG